MVITYSNRKCVVVSTLQSLTSASFAHIVKYFFTVMIYLDPNIFVGGLIGPVNSISHLSNNYKVTCGLRGISSLLLGFPTL
jgi:hypothetical protein